MADDRVNLLVQRATKAAEDMRRTVEGKPADLGLGTNVGSLAAIASMLAELSANVVEHRGRNETHVRALARIASLNVRDAEALIRHDRWKKLVEELQSVAQEAVNL